jgi:hypothetical protein
MRALVPFEEFQPDGEENKTGERQDDGRKDDFSNAGAFDENAAQSVSFSAKAYSQPA